MSETALTAATKANFARLVGDGSNPWGQNVRVSVVKSGTTMPYLIQYWSGGGHAQSIKTRDAELVIGVQATSSKLAEAAACAQRVHELLHNHGKQDNANDYLYGGDYWQILSITEQDSIYIVEQPADTITLYRLGAFYRYIMQEA